MMIEKQNKKRTLGHYAVALILAGTVAGATAIAPRLSAEEPSHSEVSPNADKGVINPIFRGGKGALAKYFSNQTKYPEKAKKEGVEGKVLVNFVVAKDGRVKDVKVKQSVHPELDSEAIRVVKTMPNWTPGTKDGKPSNFEMVLPIQFKLSTETSQNGYTPFQGNYIFSLQEDEC